MNSITSFGSTCNLIGIFQELIGQTRSKWSDAWNTVNAMRCNNSLIPQRGLSGLVSGYSSNIIECSHRICSSNALWWSFRRNNHYIISIRLFAQFLLVDNPANLPKTTLNTTTEQSNWLCKTAGVRLSLFCYEAFHFHDDADCNCTHCGENSDSKLHHLFIHRKIHNVNVCWSVSCVFTLEWMKNSYCKSFHLLSWWDYFDPISQSSEAPATWLQLKLQNPFVNDVPDETQESSCVAGHNNLVKWFTALVYWNNAKKNKSHTPQLNLRANNFRAIFMLSSTLI